MKSTKRSLAMALALSFGVLGVACTPESSDNSNGGKGGSSSTGGSGGSTGGRGGSGGSGGSTGGSAGGSSSTGGSGGSTGGSSGSGGSTAGSGGSSGGSGGSTGGSSGSGGSGGTAGGSGGSGGSSADGGKMDRMADGSGAETPAAGGKMMITVDFDPATSTPTRLCFKPEAGSGGPGGGDKSPKIDWTAPPTGTQSLVLMMEDLSNTPMPHQVVCNMKPTETGRPADVKATLPEGAQAGTGHNKPMDRWYGPGAGVRNYEITIFALATPMLQGGCGPGSTKAKAARDYLKMNKTNKAVILDYDSKVLWGSAGGACK
jgi:phosphatidylethanolamine-binding protein (PEBP) family uncharacterized protein